jgi:hypothetical protein
MAITNPRYILGDGRDISVEEWTHESKFGIKWESNGQSHIFDFGYCVGLEPTPSMDGFVVVYPNFHKVPACFKPPHNAAIYNADGSLRFHLKTPKPLTRHLPGYVHSPEEVAKLEPEGIFQVGWGFGDGIPYSERPWMWARIGLYCDVYEQRYFDPNTGEFDMTYFHVARR